ncbi:YdcF family protein [Actinosynnema sp. CA-248983]
MNEKQYTSEQVAAITDYVDVTAPPPGLAAHFIFGTNQTAPVDLVVERYHQGLAPLVIVTGGVNRHNGIVEGREFRRLLLERGVRDSDIRQEDKSANTSQNVEFSLPYLREAVSRNLPLVVICKWYHRRAIHYIRTTFPEVKEFYAITFEPLYSGVPITRENWFEHPDGKRRVIREWEEVSRRVADGTFKPLRRSNGAWQ